MPKQWPGSLEQAARDLALVAGAAVVLAVPLLLLPWHTAQHVGPTLVEGPEVRGPLLGTPSVSETFVCRGLDHFTLGYLPVVILIVGALVALLTRRARGLRSNAVAILASLVASGLLLFLEVFSLLLAHYFDRVGPARLAQQAFDASVTFAALALVLIAALRVPSLFSARVQRR